MSGQFARGDGEQRLIHRFRRGGSIARHIVGDDGEYQRPSARRDQIAGERVRSVERACLGGVLPARGVARKRWASVPSWPLTGRALRHAAPRGCAEASRSANGV